MSEPLTKEWLTECTARYEKAQCISEDNEKEDPRYCVDCRSGIYHMHEDEIFDGATPLCHECENTRLRASTEDVPILLREIERLKTALEYAKSESTFWQNYGTNDSI